MILIDANVLLEVLISGRLREAAVSRWLHNNTEPFCISMLSVHLILHFGVKDGFSVGELKTFLAYYPRVALLPNDYTAALQLLKDRDHEDALQLAVAERLGCTSIVTLDKKFAQLYGDRMRFIDPSA